MLNILVNFISGMSLNESILFWKEEYSKVSCCNSVCSHSWQKNERKYIYGIRHLYGLEGSRKRYSPPDCHAIQVSLTLIILPLIILPAKLFLKIEGTHVSLTCSYSAFASVLLRHFKVHFSKHFLLLLFHLMPTTY